MSDEAIRSGPDAQEKQRIDDLVDMQVKIISASYDKAMAYTNLIIVAGYASVFGLLQLTKVHLSKTQTLSVALLLLISILAFVLFEVYKAFFSSQMLLTLSRVINEPDNLTSLEKLVAEHEKYNLQVRNSTIWFGRIWPVVFAVTVFTGLGAAAILGYAFSRSLLAP